MKRLFIALPISESIVSALRERITPLANGLPSARIIPEHNWHITLRFLGDCHEEDVSELARIVQKAADRNIAPDLSIHALQYGPPGPIARMIWAIGTLSPIMPVREAVDEMIRESNLHVAIDGRPLKVHITLARFARALVTSTLPPINEKMNLHDSINRMMLMESILLPEGARYTCLASANFIKKNSKAT